MNQYNPLVSIVIPVYNGSKYMREAIDSALSQTYKNIEVIVVNDGSTDNTEEIALSYGDKIRYFSKENGGVATALNLAIKNAKGEYISWLSHDDVYFPNKIQRQIDELNRLDDKNTVLYSNLLVINSDNDILREVQLEKDHDRGLLSIALYPLLENLIHGCTLLVKKEIFEEFGYFKPDLVTTQDYDLWFEIFKKYPVKHIPETLIKSREHLEQGTKSLGVFRVREGEELFCMIIDNLTNAELKQISASNLDFFKKLSDRMSLFGFRKASRKALIKAFSDINKKNILLISPVSNADSEEFVNNLSFSLNKDYNAFILHVNRENIAVSINNEVIFSFNIVTPVSFYNMFFDNEPASIIRLLLPVLNIDIVHLDGFKHIGFAIIEAIKSFNIPIVYTIHDFLTLCLSQHFLDKESKFCNFNKDLESYYKCLENNPHISWLEMQDTRKIKVYREYISKYVLPDIDKIVFPSDLVKDTFSNYLEKSFDRLNYEIIEDETPYNQDNASKVLVENIAEKYNNLYKYLFKSKEKVTYPASIRENILCNLYAYQNLTNKNNLS